MTSQAYPINSYRDREPSHKTARLEGEDPLGQSRVEFIGFYFILDALSVGFVMHP